jgi:hypothetical protein
MKLVTALEAARDIRGLQPSVLYQRVNCMAAPPAIRIMPFGKDWGRAHTLTRTHQNLDVRLRASLAILQSHILISAANGAPWSAKITAAIAVLDRGWGKPQQTVSANVSVFDQMTDDEQKTMLAALEALRDA